MMVKVHLFLRRVLSWKVPNMLTALSIPLIAFGLHILILFLEGWSEMAMYMIQVFPAEGFFRTIVIPPAIVIFALGWCFPKYRSAIDWTALIAIVMWLDNLPRARQ
jgi:hypothetical protein